MVYRIDNASASTTPPAAGTPGAEGFPTNGVPGVTPATVGDAYWFYSIGEELRNIAVAAGLTPAKGNVAQVLQGLNRMFGGNFTSLSAAATLTADNAGIVQLNGSASYTVELPSPVGLRPWPQFVFYQADLENITLTTPAGGFYGPGAVAGSTSVLLGPNQIVAVWPNGAGWFVEMLGGEPHGYLPFATEGAFSWTVPPGVFEIKVIQTGAGGPGGCCDSTVTSGYFAGAGGGAGATAIYKAAVTPGTVLSGVVGTAGAPSSSAPTAGGNTTFLGVTCGGGAAGAQLLSSTAGGAGGAVTGSPTGLIGAMAPLNGGDGDDGQNGTFFGGGNGGDSWWGGGSRSNGAGTPRNAKAWGAGAGGAYNNAAGTGGAGAGGVVVIEW